MEFVYIKSGGADQTLCEKLLGVYIGQCIRLDSLRKLLIAAVLKPKIEGWVGSAYWPLFQSFHSASALLRVHLSLVGLMARRIVALACK